MAQTINTNIASLTAQRNLAASQKDAATAMQRLSSGLRINSAKDDAAGLAISNRLTSQINGINQAIRNANDGMSTVQVAEGALAETSNILQRMRELSVQSSNASVSDSDRAQIQKEVTQLVKEIDRIANSTSFGTTKLLNGGFTNKSFQVGANAGESLNLTISNMRSSELGAVNTVTFGTDSDKFLSAQVYDTSSGMVAQTLTFTVGDADDVDVSIAEDASAKDIADNITSQVGGLSATARTDLAIDTLDVDIGANDVTDATIKVNGVSLSFGDGSTDLTAETFIDASVAAINGSSELSNLTATKVGTTQLVITDDLGNDISFEVTAATDGNDSDADVAMTYSATSLNAFDGTTATDNGEAVGTDTAVAVGTVKVASGQVSFTTDTSTAKTVKVVGDQAAGAGTVVSTTASTVNPVAGTKRIDDVDISTQAGAREALGLIDAALTDIGDQRADLGAVQNRFESVVANLSNVAENSSAARSRIMDADFAQETAQLAKTQILQQAGISVLAQANAQPQNVLALLQ